MPKPKQRIPEQHRKAFGLSNRSEYITEVNEEAARVEAVNKIDGSKPDVVIEDEYTTVGGIRVQVLIERLNIRESPNTRSRILFPAKKGDIFLTDSLDGEWLSIRQSDTASTWGRGFVVAKYVEEVSHGKHSK